MKKLPEKKRTKNGIQYICNYKVTMAFMSFLHTHDLLLCLLLEERLCFLAEEAAAPWSPPIMLAHLGFSDARPVGAADCPPGGVPVGGSNRS